MMTECGWEWRKLPSNRNGLDYVVGNPLIWYTSGLHVHPFYLRALLSAEILREKGVLAIPHGKYPSVYKEMLFPGRARRPAASSVLDVEADMQVDDAPIVRVAIAYVDPAPEHVEGDTDDEACRIYDVLRA